MYEWNVPDIKLLDYYSSTTMVAKVWLWPI